MGEQVQAGIDKLPPDLRTCVILRDIEELSYQEIVDLLTDTGGNGQVSDQSRSHRVGEDFAPDESRRDERRLDKSQEARASAIEAGETL